MKNKTTLRERIQRFMYGRYGMDEFYRFLIYLCLALIIINFIVTSPVLTALELAIIVYSTVRYLSKNLNARRKENQWYLKNKMKVLSFFKLQKNKFKDRKTHVYKRCPSCKNVLRLPRKKGEHTVSCPCCHNKFNVKI